jgi:hypothetical protein
MNAAIPEKSQAESLCAAVRYGQIFRPALLLLHFFRKSLYVDVAVKGELNLFIV